MGHTFITIKNGIRFNMAIVSISAALFLSGCAATVKTGPVFFPPEPNLPRIQFLQGISDSGDVEGTKNSFSLFLTGQGENGVKPLKKPYGITAHKGKIYVCDVGQASIIVMDLAKKSFTYFHGDRGQGNLKRPLNVAFDSEDNMYVADSDRKEVVVFTPGGKFLRSFGRAEGVQPTDVLIYEDTAYVLDMTHSDIKSFNRNSGELTGTIGKEEGKTPYLALPISFALDKKGFLYATNVGLGNVVKLDRDGHMLKSFGKPGDGFGDFSRPKGIAVDNTGLIYVVDNALQNVQVFNENARLLMFFGDPGLPSGSLTLPVGIYVTDKDIDYYQKMAAPGFILEQVIFVSSQFGHDKVSIYGFGKMKGLDYDEKPKAEIKTKLEDKTKAEEKSKVEPEKK